MGVDSDHRQVGGSTEFQILMQRGHTLQIWLHTFTSELLLGKA
jgi:hypothetical protein